MNTARISRLGFAATRISLRKYTPPATAVPTSHIPIVDFSAFLKGNQNEKHIVSNELVNAFKTVGFVYLANHGIPAEKLESVYDQSKRFFNLPLEEKTKLAWETPEANRGYVAPGREKVSQLLDKNDVEKLRESSPDLKESLEIGKELSNEYQNRWPNHDKNFRSTMLNFYDTVHDLHMEVMRSIGMGLGLCPTFFDKLCDKKDHNLRLLHYPSVEKDILDKDNQTRAGAHSDYGSITSLFQDGSGGLQVKTPTGEWAEATPIPGTIVVNAGDLLARWSSDVIKSTEHRVVSPPPSSVTATTRIYPARYSIAFFCNPNMDAIIEGLPGVGKEIKYEPVKTFDYLVKRLSATY